MPYITDEKIFDFTIYAIVFHKERTFFIGKTTSNNLKETYKNHYYLKILTTKELFEKYKFNGENPPIYTLSKPRTSQRIAFRHVIAWTKFFHERGYKSLSEEYFVDYINDLTKETNDIYDRIRLKTLSAVCQPEGGEFPDFGIAKVKKGESKNDFIAFRLKEKEYEKIRKAADKAGKTISQYCKDAALNGEIVSIDKEVFQILDDFSDKYFERNQILKQIATVTKKQGEALPIDLEIIKYAIEETQNQQELAYKKLNEIIKKLK